MTIVDPTTWRDVERIEITGGAIQRENDGLMQSASVNVVNYPQNIERWIRIWLDTEQNGSNGHEALFTGLATSPTQAWKNTMHEDTLDCYSVLKPAADVDLMLGWYAQAGASGGSVIKKLLNVTPAPVDVADNSPTLTNHIIAESNETHLTMVQKVLTAIDWRLRITGDGRISVEPKPLTESAMFDPLENDIVETEINVTTDWFDCPNVFMAIQNDITAIARDDTSDSILSVENRGREVWAQESGCDIGDNETMEQYAARRLKEEQQTHISASYSRRYIPEVLPGDLVYMRYPAQSVTGLYHVKSQNIEIGYGSRTSEEIST